MKFSRDTLEKYGSGLSSVRFICGTQTIHKVKLLFYFFSIIFLFNSAKIFSSRIKFRNWKGSYPFFMGVKTQFCMHHALTQMPVYLKPFLPQKMQFSPMNSIMRRLSTAFACAEHKNNAICTETCLVRTIILVRTSHNFYLMKFFCSQIWKRD